MAKRRKDQDSPPEGLQSRYGEELLSANWNPVIDLLGASCAKTSDESSRNLSRGVEEDPDAFLKRIYNFGN